jgi:hypothetical protein
MLDPSVSGVSRSSPRLVRACLYRYFLTGSLLHAISAALYEGEYLLIKTRPIHCHTMTEQGLQLHLQAMLDTFSQSSGVVLQTFCEVNDLLLEDNCCPVRDCHLNPAYRLEELL